jgi:hypothetical protein
VAPAGGSSRHQAPPTPPTPQTPARRRLHPPKAAVERWTSIIRIDLPDVTDAYDKSNGMFPGFKYTDPVDDLVIFYRLTVRPGLTGFDRGF